MNESDAINQIYIDERNEYIKNENIPQGVKAIVQEYFSDEAEFQNP